MIQFPGIVFLHADEESRRIRRVKENLTLLMDLLINALLDAGLRLVRLEEPEADAAVLAEKPEWRDERRRPPFLLIAAERL